RTPATTSTSNNAVVTAPPRFDPSKPFTVMPEFSNVPPPRPIDLTKLKFSDIRKPYDLIAPGEFQFIVANAGTQHVSEITIGYASGSRSCSVNLADYQGFKKFPVDLTPGDSIV